MARHVYRTLHIPADLDYDCLIIKCFTISLDLNIYYLVYKQEKKKTKKIKYGRTILPYLHVGELMP